MSIVGGDIVSLVTGGVLETRDSVVAPVVSSTLTKIDKKMLRAVEKVLNKLGKLITFYVYPEATFDRATSELTPGSASTYNRKSIPPYKARIDQIDEQIIQAEDLFTGIAARNLLFSPTVNQKVVIDSVDWKILRMQPVYSGEAICLWVFQLRK